MTAVKTQPKCSEQSVWQKGGYRSYPCSRNGTVSRDGAWWCKHHDPVSKAEKDAARKISWDAEWAEQNRVRALNNAAPGMLALLVESQTSIGGDWRERRDAIIAKATETEQ